MIDKGKGWESRTIEVYLEVHKGEPSSLERTKTTHRGKQKEEKKKTKERQRRGRKEN